MSGDVRLKQLNRATAGAANSAIRTVRIEQAALARLEQALHDQRLRTALDAALEIIARRTGRLIVTGMGKSGIVARKIAATMTSTGTPAQFLHPAEASHGDLGTITPGDVVLAISWSGETAELNDILGYARPHAQPIICLTARAHRTRGRAGDVCLELPEVEEACPNNLAPTSSTTLQLVLGDALAIALIEHRGFSRSDFLTFHPGGRIGAKYAVVERLMGVGDEIPVIGADATIRDAAIEMSRKRYGATAVVDGAGDLIGAFTDGDLRRSFAAGTLDDLIVQHMTRQPVTVMRTTPMADALRIMNENAITMLFVCEGRRLTGALHLHDVLRQGVM